MNLKKIETLQLDNNLRSKIAGNFIKLPDGVTWYELAGPDDGQPIVFLNGYSIPHYLWDHTFQPLADAGFRVLRFDQYGRGWSDRPQLEHGPDLFDRQIVNLLHALGIQIPVSLVGSSMGGIVASFFADRHPQMVDKLVLIDPAGTMPPPTFPNSLLNIPLLGEVIACLTWESALPAGMAADLLHPERFPQYVADYLPQMQIAGFRRAVLSTFRSGMLWNQRAVYERLGQTDQPILMLWGIADKILPPEIGQELSILLPGADFRVIEDAGHVPHYERPDVVNEMLVDFLRFEGK